MTAVQDTADTRESLRRYIALPTLMPPCTDVLQHLVVAAE